MEKIFILHKVEELQVKYAFDIVAYSIKELKSFSRYGNKRKNGIKRPIDGWVSGKERNPALSFTNFPRQSEKISSKENRLYGIIGITITSFLDGGYSFSTTLLYHIQ